MPAPITTTSGRCMAACWQPPLTRRAVVAPSASRLSEWLAPQLHAPLAAALPVRRLTSVGGGCIHAAWRLELEGGGALFAKTGGLAALPMLQAEADGLAALAAAAAGAGTGPTIPQPLAAGELDGQGLLVLPWLELDHRGADQSWRQLGRALARLHRASVPRNGGRGYGFEADNFIGSMPQANGWMVDWGAFFVERRLAPQLEQLRRRGVRLRGSDALLERVPGWLSRHGVEPVLVHGDLWSGNAALLSGGGGALFDPAVHWADREVDLAMARLFGGFPPAFFNGYGEEWPLPAGAQQRVELYNLYHLLNHANLFDGGAGADGGPGGGYGRQAQHSLQRLLAEPG